MLELEEQQTAQQGFANYEDASKNKNQNVKY